MADNKNTEVPPASVAAAPAVVTVAPATVTSERRNWAMPLISALVVVAALVLGGFGGFALARTIDHHDAREAMQQHRILERQDGQFGGPQQGGPQQGRPGGPGQNQPGGPPQGGPNGDSDSDPDPSTTP
jgi:hypothetical protein